MSERPDLVALFAVLANDTTKASETLPGRLAAAAALALGADGASLSLFSLDLRVPLGASDVEAGTAEQLQFTLGIGPCLDVMSTGRAVACDLAQIRETWPSFARDFAARTTYQSVTSVPLPFTTRGDGGALDLYSRRSSGFHIDLADATAAADRIVAVLIDFQPVASLAGSDDASKVSWLQALPARRRMEVWVAMGIVTKTTGVDTAGAIGLLRGWARTHDLDLDTVAADVVGGRLDPELRAL